MDRKRFVLSCVATTALVGATAPPSAAESEYDLTTPTGTLFGTLRLPGNGAAVPVVLIVAGSGPTDRNGNSPMLALDTYRKLASALAERGIASVRYDKRGVAVSRAAGSDEGAIRFGTYIDDAALWLQKLRGDKRFTNVSLAGHSEGSLIGMVAAQRAQVESYISLEGAGFPAAQLLQTQLTAQLGGNPELLAQSRLILDRLVQGGSVPDVPPTLAPIFRPAIQPYLMSWFKYDPRVELARVVSRVTIVQGTHDLQVPVDNGKALAAVEGKATFVLVNGMTHVLSDDPGTTMAEQIKGAYADAARPLDPAVVDAVVAAVRG